MKRNFLYVIILSLFIVGVVKNLEAMKKTTEEGGATGYSLERLKEHASRAGTRLVSTPQEAWESVKAARPAEEGIDFIKELRSVQKSPERPATSVPVRVPKEGAPSVMERISGSLKNTFTPSKESGKTLIFKPKKIDLEIGGEQKGTATVMKDETGDTWYRDESGRFLKQNPETKELEYAKENEKPIGNLAPSLEVRHRVKVSTAGVAGASVPGVTLGSYTAGAAAAGLAHILDKGRGKKAVKDEPALSGVAKVKVAPTKYEAVIRPPAEGGAGLISPREKSEAMQFDQSLIKPSIIDLPEEVRPKDELPLIITETKKAEKPQGATQKKLVQAAKKFEKAFSELRGVLRESEVIKGQESKVAKEPEAEDLDTTLKGLESLDIEKISSDDAKGILSSVEERIDALKEGGLENTEQYERFESMRKKLDEVVNPPVF